MAEPQPDLRDRLFFLDPVAPLLVAALTTPSLAVIAPLGLAPMFIGTAILALVLSWRAQVWRAVDPVVAAALAVLIAWCLLSALWALDTRQTIKGSLTILAEVVLGLGLAGITSRLDPARSRLLALTLAWGVSLGVLFMVLEVSTPGLTPFIVHYPDDPARTTHYRLARLARAYTILALFGVPVCLWLWRGGYRTWASALALVTLALVMNSHSLASKLALPLAWIVAALAGWRPRLAARLVAAAMLAVVAAMPLLAFLPPPQATHDAMPWLPASAHHRLTIWQFTAQRVLERPVLGWSMDGARSIPGADDEVMIVRHDLGGVPVPEAQLPLHPHNAPLQWWLELGLGGLLAIAVLLGRLITLAGRRPGIAPSAVLAALSSAFCIASVSYGFWQSWWQGSLWLLVAMLAGLCSCPPLTQSSSKAFL